jgi:putative hemolysin
MREAPVVSDRTGALDVIQSLRKSPAHMVLVYDEYGHFEGIVTSGDVLEAITGVFREDESEEPAFVGALRRFLPGVRLDADRPVR